MITLSFKCSFFNFFYSKIFDDVMLQSSGNFILIYIFKNDLSNDDGGREKKMQSHFENIQKKYLCERVCVYKCPLWSQGCVCV